MEKIKHIQSIMPSDACIIVRTEGLYQWFVHYFIGDNSIYQTYTEDLETTLDKVIEIIKTEPIE